MNILMLLSVTAILTVIGIGCASAQTAPDNYLKMKGKVLDNRTADITVWADNDGDWKSVRTMKNRSKYSLKLDPEENYYIVFVDNTDGTKKVLHVDAGTTGMWIMQLDINFDQNSVKYARLYRDPKQDDYTVKVIHKDNQRIVIGKTNTYADTEVLSQHEGK